MIACLVLLVVGLISLTLFLIFKCKKYSVKATALKALTSVCFISIALVGWYYVLNKELTIFGLFVVLGAIFGMLGDISLELKYVFKEEDTIFTKLGFLTFGIGHIFYIIGILNRYFIDANILYIVIPVIISLIFTFIVHLLEKPMKLEYGKMKPIALSYGFILFLMASIVFSINILTGFNSLSLLLFLIGGILFIVSDLILSGTYFGVGKERPVDLISNTVTYYFAQFLIALSVITLFVSL